ncbi:MAG: NAD(P)H-quinone oxidoreductase [Rhodospirillaceae bacterium]|nr:NAD(P)H-quinone oxidoreductase [Rhodospirillaceae bacterium]
MNASIPNKMTAIEAQGTKADNLAVVERDVPTPGNDEVLIKIIAAGVNRPDILQRKGLYPAPPGASDILGLEASGTVVALGKNISSLKLGDEVTALLNGGGYAQYATVPATQCLPIPSGLSMIEAAALPETFFTVWSNLFDRAGLKSGETLLIHGGTSGIGTAGIQITSALGVHVITTAGTDEKCNACLDLGAKRAINYRVEDFVDPVREFGKEHTGVSGVNVILDMVGGDYVQKNIKSLAPDGRLVNIAFLNGSKVELDLMTVMLNRLTLTGSTLRARSPEFKGDIAHKLEKNVWPLLKSGRISPIISSVFPLEKAGQAHSLMESSRHIGKIVLQT